MKNLNLIEPKTLSGFMELEPSRQRLFNAVLDTIRHSFEAYSFLPIDTPVIEYSSVLNAKAGEETQKQIYRFLKGDTDMSLRFDLTVPLAKYVAKNYHNLTFPFRRYQIGKVYRGERPQKGRFREFYQADIDIVGDGALSIFCDAEIPSIIAGVFKSLGFNDFTIMLSNRKILQGFLESLKLQEKTTAIGTVLDKLKKIGIEKVKEELVKLDIKKSAIDKITKFISIAGTTNEQISILNSQFSALDSQLFTYGVNELQQVIDGIRAFGISDKNFQIDLSIIRGLDYYTGTVFETFIMGHESVGSVCSGGRYGNLAGLYIDKQLPGVGISIGVTRLFDKLESELAKNLKPTPSSDVLVVSADNNITSLIPIAMKLKELGLSPLLFLEDTKLKKKFQYAEKLNIPFMVIIGENERETNTITLKNLNSGKQLEQIALKEVHKIIIDFYN